VSSSVFDPRASVRECGSALPLSSPLARLTLCLLLLICAMGCRSISPTSKSIDQLHLLVTSVALNLDDKPGADGVGVRLYASHRGETEALAITTGTLDILMFDGNVPLEELPTHTPLYTWSFPAAKLTAQLQETSIGTSYRFAALWGEHEPKDDRVTLVARYTAPGGQPIYSAPSSVPVGIR
jgi:hypothetical protein